MLGSLPPRVRELYRLPFGPREQRAFAAGVALLRGFRRLTPGPLARGSSQRAYDLVADTERRRIARGAYTPQVRPGMFASPAASGQVEDDLAGRAAAVQ
jgi:hypothetical protein